MANSRWEVGVFVLPLSQKRCPEESLEGAVEERRMKAVLVESIGKHCRNGDLGDGPVLTGGHALDGTERVTVIESDGLGAIVEVVTADRGDRLGASCAP